MEYVIRFFVGGIVVSVFALLGDVLRPKSFAGLFGAAPSVALATLALAIAKDGGDYASVEAHTMIFGSVALGVYCFAVCQLLMRFRLHALGSATLALTVWFATALALERMLVG